MSRYVSPKEALFAVELALEGQKWLKFKWEGSYGNEYPRSIRDHRIAEITKDIQRLRAFRNKLKA